MSKTEAIESLKQLIALQGKPDGLMRHLKTLTDALESAENENAKYLEMIKKSTGQSTTDILGGGGGNKVK